MAKEEYRMDTSEVAKALADEVRHDLKEIEYLDKPNELRKSISAQI